MKSDQTPPDQTPDPESASAGETRLAATKAQLDQLFRQAGKGHETRALYQAVLDYRMEKGK